jgi:hypothetical protein
MHLVTGSTTITTTGFLLDHSTALLQYRNEKCVSIYSTAAATTPGWSFQNCYSLLHLYFVHPYNSHYRLLTIFHITIYIIVMFDQKLSIFLE